MSILFEPTKLGDIDVKNRVFMAPLTRNRAHRDGTPHEIAVTYYAQRASAGLIVSEGSQIAPMAKGYVNTPGIHNAKQITAWKEITDAVHAKGGKIVLQLWHVGRISHTSLLPHGNAPLAPSAIQAEAPTFTEDGPANVSAPRELSAAEIETIVTEYTDAAQASIDAGFDGVEVHGANGYLLNQFISTNTNDRTDAYGGSPENRAKLLLDVVDAVSERIGRGRVGVRLSPTGTFNDIHDGEASATYSFLFAEIDKRELAFLHVVEAFPGFEPSGPDKDLIQNLRTAYSGNYIANGGYDKDSAAEAVEKGAAAVSFGRMFISNPDLPERLRLGAELNSVDDETLYGGDEKGYIDYQALSSAA
ncbi:N-ethylmaleimide reductase [Roseovarius albus]|uniref:N-ethylmaleimide reductase n=1 Tax=Roseovarius albus TaxID=1247867 RepID=A0A1X6ZUU6_9RHOB|nr:alkene reductase [Roseovarius albus]SLN62181.1 N-ethylmaleimide reductase [Roseovarius albus]